MRQRDWTSIFLLGFVIAFGAFFLVWLRIEYLDLSSNPAMEEILYFMPHIIMIISGAILGILIRDNPDNQNLRLSFIRQPFLSVWIGALAFSIAFSLWTARPNHFMSNRSYISDAFSGLILSFLVSVVWIVIPFFIGCSVTKFIQYTINSMHNKKQR